MKFSDDGILLWLERADNTALDALNYGVIGIDRDGRVQRYNDWEARTAQLEQADVIGRFLFTEIALCMNNALVAGRFTQAREKQQTLDVTIDYVLAFRAGAGPVHIRLLYSPEATLSYLLIKRLLA